MKMRGATRTEGSSSGTPVAFGGAAIGAMGLGAGRLMAGYRLFAAAVLLTLVTSVHFVGEEREAPIRDIYAVYDSPV